MIIEMRLNIQNPQDGRAIKDMVVCALSGIGHGEKKGMSMIPGAGVAWKVTKYENMATHPDELT